MYCMHVVLLKKILIFFSNIFGLLNFESLMGPHFSRTGRGVKRLKYKPYDDACIVMSQIVIKIIILLLKLFNPRQLIFIFNLKPLLGASIAPGLLSKQFRIYTKWRRLYTFIKNCSILVLKKTTFFEGFFFCWTLEVEVEVLGSRMYNLNVEYWLYRRAWM